MHDRKNPAAEVIEALEEARAEWLAAAIEQGLTIPRLMGERESRGTMRKLLVPARSR